MKKVFRTLSVLALSSLVVVGISAYLRGPNGVPAAVEKRNEMRRMEDENQRLREEVERRKEEIRRLDTDQRYRDRKYREMYKMQKPNEQTIYLQEQPAPAPAK